MTPQAEWRLLAMDPYHKRRVEQAKNYIIDALALGAAYVSVSGGKDSVALLHLVRSIAPDTPAWHIDSGMESPDTIAIINQLSGVTVVRPELTIDKMCEMVGAFGYSGPNKLDGDWHWSNRDWKSILIQDPAQKLREQHRYTVTFTGMRADESKGRTMMMRKYGAIHRRADGCVFAHPLARWTGQDSLSYCASNGLPISEIYLRPGHVPPADRRTGTMLGGSAATRGRYTDIKRHHPQTWDLMIERFPELRNYL